MFRNLLTLFLKNGHIFVFFLLELICLWLIIAYNQPQKAIFKNTTGIFSGYFQEKKNSFDSYLNLTDLSDSLAIENSRLKEEIFVLLQKMEKDTIFTIDSTHKFNIFPARIINNSVNQIYNTFTINKGFKHGVKERQGVMDKNGVIGIITKVGPKYSVGISMLNCSFKLSGAVLNTNLVGSVQWDGQNIQNVQFFDIPKYEGINRGDTIVTSGYSSIFPSNIPIGIIDTFWVNSGENYYSIQLSHITNFQTLNYIYLIENLDQEDIFKIQSEENE